MSQQQQVTLADGADWVGGVAVSGVFLLLIVIVWQIAVTWRARMLAAREAQYKELAARYAQLLEENVALHRRSLEEMQQTRDELTETRRLVSSMEMMMREIE